MRDLRWRPDAFADGSWLDRRPPEAAERVLVRTSPVALWASPIGGERELAADFLPEYLWLAARPVAFDDALGALERVALGCIVADADGDIVVEGQTVVARVVWSA
ncbi:hypothetical protein [Bradyrhizobium sp. STM 3566]|uniref:hypothetical protein n=1 Tax=Bradyrhizobium sp. STM 3566 TaxID=578928 RepID=UPI0038901262